jgi:TonB family protein
MSVRTLTVWIPGTVLLFWSVSTAAPSVCRAQETQPSVADSADGLKSQIGAILQSAKDPNSKRFDDMISNLQIPDNSGWFTPTFGDDLGPTLAAKYKGSWGDFQDVLTRSFRDSADAKAKDISVVVFGASSPFAHANMSSVQQSARNPLTLYEATVRTRKWGTSAIPGLYVYVAGAFRVVNWTTLYGLPNVRPMRIRVGGNVAQAKLVHQVNPVLPPDALKSHAQGMVQVHVIIDVDGNVKQVDILSGDPELAAAARDAVKQWRYRPTTLNGDPVEVDATVSVNFSLGG